MCSPNPAITPPREFNSSWPYPPAGVYGIAVTASRTLPRCVLSVAATPDTGEGRQGPALSWSSSEVRGAPSRANRRRWSTRLAQPRSQGCGQGRILVPADGRRRPLTLRSRETRLVADSVGQGDQVWLGVLGSNTESLNSVAACSSGTSSASTGRTEPRRGRFRHRGFF